MIVERSLSAVANSNMVKVSHLTPIFNQGIGVTFTGGGSAAAKVQYTFDDPDTATDATGTGLAWFDHATLTGLSSNAAGNMAFPVRAMRLVVSAWTGPMVVKAAFIQAGV